MKKFIKRNIHSLKTQNQETKKNSIFRILTILLLISLIFYTSIVFIQLILARYDIDLGHKVKDIAFSFNQDLIKDKHGAANILLIGTGDEMHDGSDLTDTLIIANINFPENTVNLISIPRDLFVKTSIGNIRINRVYELSKLNSLKENDREIANKKDEETAIKLLTEELSEVTGLEIPYYVKVNFDGFEDIIDSIGGIDIVIKESIYDPYYPKEGSNEHEIFNIKAGFQHIDGKTALKYARSRKTTSDFSRSKRQQELLLAIKNNIMEKHILISPLKVQRLFSSVTENITTNVSFREILTLAAFGNNLNPNSIKTVQLHDEPISQGGFLYTPERQYFGGAFVLIPYGNNFDDIHNYISLNSQFSNETKYYLVQVLNGTLIPGLASHTKFALKRFGLDVIRFGNARKQNHQKTTIYVKDPNINKSYLKKLSEILNANISYEVPGYYLNIPYKSDAHLIIEIGRNIKPILKKYNIIEYN